MLLGKTGGDRTRVPLPDDTNKKKRSKDGPAPRQKKRLAKKRQSQENIDPKTLTGPPNSALSPLSSPNPQTKETLHQQT